MKNQKDN